MLVSSLPALCTSTLVLSSLSLPCVHLADVFCTSVVLACFGVSVLSLVCLKSVTLHAVVTDCCLCGRNMAVASRHKLHMIAYCSSCCCLLPHCARYTVHYTLMVYSSCVVSHGRHMVHQRHSPGAQHRSGGHHLWQLPARLGLMATLHSASGVQCKHGRLHTSMLCPASNKPFMS